MVTVNSNNNDKERFENVEMYAEKASSLLVMPLANVKRAAILSPWTKRNRRKSKRFATDLLLSLSIWGKNYRLKWKLCRYFFYLLLTAYRRKGEDEKWQESRVGLNMILLQKSLI